jgi:hypothetical protein
MPGSPCLAPNPEVQVREGKSGDTPGAASTSGLHCDDTDLRDGSSTVGMLRKSLLAHIATDDAAHITVP